MARRLINACYRVVLGHPLLVLIAVAVVLALSVLLATTGICVGCELYLVGQRLRATVGEA